MPKPQGERASHDIRAADIHVFSRHFFPATTEAGFVPEKLEVNGRKGRRVVCVLGRDRLHYRIFDLDGEAEDGTEGGEEEEEEADDDAMSP